MTQQAAVLFDLDGTLLDTAPDLGATANVLLAEHGCAPLTHAQARQLSSHGAVGLLKAGFAEDWLLQNQAALRERFLAHYQQHICIDTNFFPGIRQALASLDKQGIPWLSLIHI